MKWIETATTYNANDRLHSFLGACINGSYTLCSLDPDGVEGTWAFFNLIFVQNLNGIFMCWNTYSIKIGKTWSY